MLTATENVSPASTAATENPKLTFVLPYDPAFRNNTPFYWNAGLGWPQNAEHLGLNCKFIGAKSEFAEAVLHEIENDDGAVIVFLGGDVHLDFLIDTPEKRRRLLDLNKPLICRNCESVLTGTLREFYWPKALHALEIFDCFLTSDEIDMDFYRLRGAKAIFSPQQSDSLQFRVKTPWHQRTPKGFFLGKTTTFGIDDSIYRPRRVLIESLLDCPYFSFIDRVNAIYSPDPLIDLYNKHQVCVCLPTNNRGITVRFFEAAMCGATILHYELEGQPESESILKPGVNCLTYRPRDPDDLKTKLRFLIENPEKAMELAVNAISDVSSNHTIAVRLQQIAAVAREFVAPDAPVRPAYLNPR